MKIKTKIQAGILPPRQCAQRSRDAMKIKTKIQAGIVKRSCP